MQYNVEWLFLTYYAPMDCPGNGCSWKNETDAQNHLQYVSNVVNTLQPDILNMCEVEGVYELQTLAHTLEGLTYLPYFIQGTDTATGQNVGMLSRISPSTSLRRTNATVPYPVTNSSCGYEGTPGKTGVSKHYITEFEFAPGLHVAFIAAHLVAIPTDPARCAQREAQAYVLQSVIRDYLHRLQYEVVVLGDFNDYDNVVHDVNGNVPLSHTLQILKDTGDANTTLVNMLQYVEEEERYSDWWDSDNNCNTDSIHDYSLIDHVLVSPRLVSYVDTVFVFHGYDEHCGKRDSDHYPVVLDFVF